MENGTYGHGNTDFRKYVMSRFQPTLWHTELGQLTTCGANALSLITGVHPVEVFRKNKFKQHFSDDTMLRYLRKYGFKSFKVTKCNLTRHTKNSDQDIWGYIGPNNLLLTCQLLKKNEASWFVYWDELQFHNFELSRATFAALLNFPIISAYVLYNPKWVN